MQFNACQAAGLVQSGQGSADHARRIARQDKQANALFALSVGGTSGDNQQVGRGAIDNLCVLAVKGPAAEARCGHDLHAASLQPRNTGEGQGGAGFAGGNRPQPVLLKGFIVPQQQGGGGQACRRE
ncbi:hypothetical protein D3C81_1672510 [compost metagenome]